MSAVIAYHHTRDLPSWGNCASRRRHGCLPQASVSPPIEKVSANDGHNWSDTPAELSAPRIAWESQVLSGNYWDSYSRGRFPRAFRLLLPRFVHRHRDGLSVGDLNEITHGHAIEVARVACLDRRCLPCRPCSVTVPAALSMPVMVATMVVTRAPAPAGFSPSLARAASSATVAPGVAVPGFFTS